MAAPVLVALAFLAAVAGALALMAYIAWRGSKPSNFFLEAVNERYELELPELEIEAYFALKDRIRKNHTPPADSREAVQEDDEEDEDQSWIRRVAPEHRMLLRNALMKRLVSCFDKLDQVQRDKPGNWKLWRGKLVSERYWASLCEAERLVSEEIDACVAEADVLEPGWKQHIFPQAVQLWRMSKQQEAEKKELKKAVEQEKKAKEKEIKAKENEERQKEEDKVRQEKLAQKAMEKLLREEEAAAAAKPKVRAAAPKSKGTKKK